MDVLGPGHEFTRADHVSPWTMIPDLLTQGLSQHQFTLEQLTGKGMM
jgi:hypothetical protein